MDAEGRSVNADQGGIEPLGYPICPPAYEYRSYLKLITLENINCSVHLN